MDESRALTSKVMARPVSLFTEPLELASCFLDRGIRLVYEVGSTSIHNVAVIAAAAISDTERRTSQASATSFEARVHARDQLDAVFLHIGVCRHDEHGCDTVTVT